MWFYIVPFKVPISTPCIANYMIMKAGIQYSCHHSHHPMYICTCIMLYDVFEIKTV